MEPKTIAAIATAPGLAGVAVVRVSGPDAYAVAAKVAGRTIRPGLQFVRMPLDECVVLGFTAPRSYTGEDVVEFQCHGGAVVPRQILEALFAAGARLARRGEFTERAFLNGKLDYEQAESVLDLIHAKTARAADAAREGLAGRREAQLRGLYDQALTLSSELEHALDIDEGELPENFFTLLHSSLNTLTSTLAVTIRSLREGRLLREGALVVLAGPPNAGKSSLMNALLEENRAIVSDIPGTTRDTIEEWMDLGGFPIRLVDTAGLRETGDRIEAEGVKRAEDLIAKADVVLELGNEVDEDWVARDRSVASPLVRGGTVLRLQAKCDLLPHTPQTLQTSQAFPSLRVSAKTGEGLAELKRAIVQALEKRVEEAGAVTTPRREGTAGTLSVLLEVETLLRTLDCGLRTSGCWDLVLAGNVVRQATERLGTLIGATYSADLLDRLFSRFCVGK